MSNLRIDFAVIATLDEEYNAVKEVFQLQEKDLKSEKNFTTESLALQGGDGFNSSPDFCFWRGSMASGDEGLLTLSIGMRVSPEPEAVELLKRYNTPLNYAINKILRLNLKKIGEVHSALYRELREWFGLPSRVAIDCYRDALANANAWRNNPRKGRRPRVRKLSMLLHPGSGYRIKDGYVEIIGGIKLKIIGWDRRYNSYENGEARLVYKDGKMML